MPDTIAPAADTDQQTRQAPKATRPYHAICWHCDTNGICGTRPTRPRRPTVYGRPSGNLCVVCVDLDDAGVRYCPACEAD